MADEINEEKAYNHSEMSAELTRQVTLNLSEAQYERLFFQPNQAKGDLAARLGTLAERHNPSPAVTPGKC